MNAGSKPASSSNPLSWAAINASAKAVPKQVHTSTHSHETENTLEAVTTQVAPEEADAPTGTQEPLGGAEIHDSNTDFVLEGGMVEPFVETSILMLVPEKYQTVSASVGNIVICLANTYIIDSLSVALGVAINPIGGINTTTITLAMIKKKIQELQKDVDKLMHADYKTAFNRYQKALTFMTNPKMHKSAFKEYGKVVDLAERAYNQVKDFDKKILCKKLALFGQLMTLMYEKEKETFLPLEKLSEDTKATIAQYVYDEISTSIGDYKVVISELYKGFSLFNQKRKTNLEKDKNQNLLDSLLKYGLPLMWHYNEVFQKEPKYSDELLQFIPEGEQDAAEILMTSGQWIKVWKVFNQDDEEMFLWSLKNVSGDTDPETYVGYVDGILKCKFKCIDWSTSRFEDAYSKYKQGIRDVTDDEVRSCEVKLFFKFWEFPALVFRFEESTHIVALETKSMSVVYYNMEPSDLFQDGGKAVILLGSIESCPKLINSIAKHMGKITLFETNKCIPKEFLLKFFANLDKTKLVLNSGTVDSKKIKTFLAKCPCIKACKKGTFTFHHREPSNMFSTISELENQAKGLRPWYKKI